MSIENVAKNFSSVIGGMVAAALVKQVGKIADVARQNAPTDNIESAIKVGNLVKVDGVSSISIIVDLKVAPEGAAYEYGSGIHGEKGVVYPITPKKAPSLAFPVGPEPGRWPKYSGELETGDYIYLPHVLHPGVKARPYLKPAIDKMRSGLKNTVMRAFLKGYRDVTPLFIYMEVEV